MGHLPHEGVIELPRSWKEVRNGEDGITALEGHVTIASDRLEAFLACSGRWGVFTRQIRDRRDPQKEKAVDWLRRQPDEEFRAYYARAIGLAEEKATGLTCRLGSGARLGLERGEHGARQRHVE
eukprot:12476150-Alexandrium_andersonii.AAC.1